MNANPRAIAGLGELLLQRVIIDGREFGRIIKLVFVDASEERRHRLQDGLSGNEDALTKVVGIFGEVQIGLPVASECEDRAGWNGVGLGQFGEIFTTGTYTGLIDGLSGVVDDGCEHLGGDEQRSEIENEARVRLYERVRCDV